RLAIALEYAGANVQLAALPACENGSAQGPDDFLAVCGRKALENVIGAMVPANPIDRVKIVTGEQALELLEDLPFLFSLKERGIVVQQKVETVLRKHKVKVADLRRALRQVEEQSRRQNADGKMQRGIPYVEHDGALCIASSRADG